MEQAFDTYLGLNCLRLRNGRLTLRLTLDVGPRLLTLQLDDGPNLLAELPDFAIDCPGAGRLQLWGGHRLWVAPEVAALTYLPDERPVAIEVDEDIVTVTAPIEPATGLAKRWRLRLPTEEPELYLAHSLDNHGTSPIMCAPWAITQMRVGGSAILPQFTGRRDRDGLQPNRAIALWPYTDVNSPHLAWGNAYLLLHARLTDGAVKVGWPNRPGWLGYHWQDTLFIKEAHFDPEAVYYDLGSSSQCYVNDQFLELETLGPQTHLTPGASVTHHETWHLTREAFDPEAIAARMREKTSEVY